MSTSFSNKFSESGIVTHSLNDFVNALINNDLNALSERKQPITEEPTKEIAQPVAVKSKARIKPKVQRLDSLTCFGGGNQLKIENSEYSTPSKTSDDSWKKGSEHESKSTNSSEAVEPTPFVSKSSEIVTPPTDTKENISSITTAFAKENEPSIALDSKRRKRRPKVQQLGNLMMRDIPKVATEKFQEQRDGDLKRIKLETDTSTEKSILAKSLPRNDKEDSNLIKYKYDSTKLGKENDATNNGYKQKDDLDDVKKGVISDESTPQDQPSSFEKSEKSSQRVTDRPRSIAKLETNLPERRKTNDIVSAIAETKQKEVRRFQEGIFEVDQSELTESSLEEFKNVAKVEKTKVKPRVLHPTVVSDKSAIWAGRKNFKRFTKKWPSYMKSCSIETNTGHIPYPKDNNNNNRYIAMKRFDYRKDGKSEENNGINIEVDFRLPNRMEGSNELSLQQSGETESAQESRIASGFGFKSKPKSVPERNTLFITEDDDDSYDDDAPALHGNKTGKEDDISLQSNRSVSFGTNSLERSNSADADTDDDDDDENDIRRFNFRSRRRK
ncbi:DNA repair protein XRS2 [Kluyveromyces marxianus]